MYFLCFTAYFTTLSLFLSGFVQSRAESFLHFSSALRRIFALKAISS